MKDLLSCFRVFFKLRLFYHYRCDQYSNCLEGNARIIKACTIFSPPVCEGCADENYFDPGAGPSGGCVECSARCGPFEVETRKCTTEHDRTCAQRVPTTTLIPSRLLVILVCFCVCACVCMFAIYLFVCLFVSLFLCLRLFSAMRISPPYSGLPSLYTLGCWPSGRSRWRREIDFVRFFACLWTELKYFIHSFTFIHIGKSPDPPIAADIATAGTNADASTSGLVEPTTEVEKTNNTSSEEEPLYKKWWFWLATSIPVVSIVAFTVRMRYKRTRRRGNHSAGNAGGIMMQQMFPLIPRGKAQFTVKPPFFH